MPECCRKSRRLEHCTDLTPEIAIDRLQCFLKWNASRIDALDEAHETIESPACYTRGKGERLEYWITAATRRDVILGYYAMLGFCGRRITPI